MLADGGMPPWRVRITEEAPKKRIEPFPPSAIIYNSGLTLKSQVFLKYKINYQ